MRNHSFFVLYNLYKDSNFQTNLKEKSQENRLGLKQNIIQATRITIHGKYYADLASSVASPICQEGQSERNCPIFPLFTRFLPLLSDISSFFPWFFLIFPDFFPLFPDFWQFFRCQGWHSIGPCITLNAHTTPAAFVPCRVSHALFLLASLLEQTSEDCIENTKHSKCEQWVQLKIIFAPCCPNKYSAMERFLPDAI